MNVNIDWCEKKDLEKKAVNLIKPTSVVLDIGCGIRPQRYIIPDFAICVEPHFEYIEQLKKNICDSNILIIPLEALIALKSLPDRSVDSIFLIDVIEHMSKDIGVQVLEECLRVARIQIIVFTPLGFMPQSVHAGEPDGWGLNGGAYQEHKSGWYPEDFPHWEIIACKDLHSVDHRGAPLNPPYGGFYAIKNFVEGTELLSSMHIKEHIPKSMDKLLWSDFFQNFLTRELAKINNKCSIQISVNSAEQLCIGLNEKVEEFDSEMQLKKSKMYDDAKRIFSEKVSSLIRDLSTTSIRESELGIRESELGIRESELGIHKSELGIRESELGIRESELGAHEVELRMKESMLMRQEAKINIFNSKLIIKLMRFFKIIDF